MAFPNSEFYIGIKGGDFILYFALRTLAFKFNSGKIKIIKLLLHYGANSFINNYLGKTTLHIFTALLIEKNG